MQKSIALYLDMDGCFTDFTSRAYEVYDKFHLIEGLYSDEIDCTTKAKIRSEMVRAISAKTDFWHTLDWISNGRTLYNFILDNFDPKNISMLTAPMSNDPNCHDGKRMWVKNEMKEINNIIIDDNKSHYVNHLAGDIQILIDDREKNIIGWNNAGGIGILHHHTNIENTIEQLKSFI